MCFNFLSTVGGYQRLNSPESYGNELLSVFIHQDTDVGSSLLVRKRFVCGVCGKSFQFRNDYVGHMNSKHLNRRPYKCSFCNTSFPYSQSLRRHLLTLHNVKK